MIKKSTLKTVAWIITPFLAFCLTGTFGETLSGDDGFYLEIGNSFIGVSIGITILLLYVFNITFKYLTPTYYVRYQTWKESFDSHFKSSSFILSFAACTIYVFTILVYINQHYATSPVQTIKTKIANKCSRITSGRSRKYTDYFITFNTAQGEITMVSHQLFEMLNKNDDVLVKIQKGRLNHYFALELQIVKNNFKTEIRHSAFSSVLELANFVRSKEIVCA